MKNLLARIWWNLEWSVLWVWKYPWNRSSSNRKIKAYCCRQKPYTDEELMGKK